jgi:hypothetical protein
MSNCGMASSSSHHCFLTTQLHRMCACVCVCRGGGGGLLVRVYEAVTIEIILPRFLFQRKFFSQFHEKVCIMHCNLDFTERDLNLKI